MREEAQITVPSSLFAQARVMGLQSDLTLLVTASVDCFELAMMLFCLAAAFAVFANFFSQDCIRPFQCPTAPIVTVRVSGCR
jgi:hypothetical protein